MRESEGLRFEEVDHTADIAIRVWGRDLAELFANAAYGMACQLGQADHVIPTHEQQIELEAYDLETLLVTWLSELLYLLERDGRVFTEFDIHEVTETRLRATIHGGPAVERRYAIKAVTFSDLQVARTAHGYETTIVFDV